MKGDNEITNISQESALDYGCYVYVVLKDRAVIYVGYSEGTGRKKQAIVATQKRLRGTTAIILAHGVSHRQAKTMVKTIKRRMQQSLIPPVMKSSQDKKLERVMKTPDKRVSRQLRNAALQVLGGICVKCGYADMRGMHIDHIQPLRGRGRKDNQVLYREIIAGNTDNLQLLCVRCHREKTYDDIDRL